MKHLIFLFSVLMLCITSSCSENKDYEPEPPIMEEAPKYVLQNEDGTYYALTSSTISLKTPDNKTLKSIAIDIPTPESVNAGYGTTKELIFELVGLQRYDNGVLTLARSRDDVLNEFHCYAIKVNLDLTSSSQYKINAADFYEICNNHFIAGKRSGEFYIYNQNFAIEKNGVIDGNISNFAALGYLDSKFYALAYLNRQPQNDSGYFIINLSDLSYVQFKVENAWDVAASAFPNETKEPRLEGQTYAFVDGHIEITYSFTLYDGSKHEVILKYDLLGHSLDEHLANSPVNIDLAYYGTWDVYGVHSAGDFQYFCKDKQLPSSFNYLRETYTGFGGVYIIRTFLGDIKAFDATCPVEQNRDLIVSIDPETYHAICSACGSHYDIFENNGAPISGNALELKYGMKPYTVVSMGSGYKITN